MQLCTNYTKRDQNARLGIRSVGHYLLPSFKRAGSQGASGKEIISVFEKFLCVKNKCFFLCLIKKMTPQGYKTPFKCECVVTNVLPQSGSGVSSAKSEGGVFCLYMKVNRKSAMSCETQ